MFWGTTNTPRLSAGPHGQPAVLAGGRLCSRPNISPYADLTDEVVGQLWAEAQAYYQMGGAASAVRGIGGRGGAPPRRTHERDDLQGLIEEYLAKPLPDDWYKRTDLSWRLNYLTGVIQVDDSHLVPRDRVCAAEVWREVSDGAPPNPPIQEARRINHILESLPGWERTGDPQRFGLYGRQRGFRRIGVHKAGKVLCL